MLTYDSITIKDLDLVIPFYIEAFNNEPWHDHWNEDSAKERLIRMMNNPSSISLGIYLNDLLIGIMIGYTEMYYNGEIFELREFCIDPRYSHQGIGSQSLQYLEKYLININIHRIYFYTHPLEKEFYHKRGYDLDDIIYMTKEIAVF